MPTPLRVVLLAHPGQPRVASFQSALADAGHPPAIVVAWRDWLTQPDRLTRHLATPHPTWLKIEAPGEVADGLDLLLRHAAHAHGEPPPAPLAHGELAHGARGHEGLRLALNALALELQDLPTVRCLNPPRDILAMADKLQCQRTLAAAGVAVPPLLGAIDGFESLAATLRHCGRCRVFVKPRYGSSAAGVVALETDGRGRYRATTSVEMLARGSAAPRLFNSLRIRRYRDAEVATLIDALAPHAPYVEQWIPKPRLGPLCFDLRVLTLAQGPRHRVARLSRHPLTNLHLGNRRHPVDACLGPAEEARLSAAATQAAACFPASLVAGIDLIVARGRAHVLEMNAFGDWLPHLAWHGQSVHQAQVALLESLAHG